MAMAFNFEDWLNAVDFASEEARTKFGAWLRNADCTTRGALLGLDVDKDTPEEFLRGWKTALRTSIATLQAEAGLSAQSNFPFCSYTILTTIHRLSPFPFRSLHPFRLPFFHHTNSTRRRRTRRRYVCNYDEPICFILCSHLLIIICTFSLYHTRLLASDSTALPRRSIALTTLS